MENTIKLLVVTANGEVFDAIVVKCDDYEMPDAQIHAYLDARFAQCAEAGKDFNYRFEVKQ